MIWMGKDVGKHIAGWFAQVISRLGSASDIADQSHSAQILNRFALLSWKVEFYVICRGWQIAVDVASAMTFLHARGLVHLDIKTLNILLRVHTLFQQKIIPLLFVCVLGKETQSYEIMPIVSSAYLWRDVYEVKYLKWCNSNAKTCRVEEQKPSLEILDLREWFLMAIWPCKLLCQEPQPIVLLKSCKPNFRGDWGRKAEKISSEHLWVFSTWSVRRDHPLLWSCAIFNVQFFGSPTIANTENWRFAIWSKNFH